MLVTYDDFNDNRLDRTKWIFAPEDSVFERNGRLEFKYVRTFPGGVFCYAKTVKNFEFRTDGDARRFQVRFLTGGGGAWLVVEERVVNGALMIHNGYGFVLDRAGWATVGRYANGSLTLFPSVNVGKTYGVFSVRIVDSEVSFYFDDIIIHKETWYFTSQNIKFVLTAALSDKDPGPVAFDDVMYDAPETYWIMSIVNQMLSIMMPLIIMIMLISIIRHLR